MATPPTLEDKKRAFAEDGTWFENDYSCDCGAQWTNEWSRMCADDCPACGTACSPFESNERPPP